MSIKKKLQAIIKKGLNELNIDFDINNIIIETPKDVKNGDYSTNIALVLTKVLNDNPMNIASKISLIEQNEPYSLLNIISSYYNPVLSLIVYGVSIVPLPPIAKILASNFNTGRSPYVLSRGTVIMSRP